MQQATQNYTPREVITPIVGQRTFVRLDYDEPKERQGRYGLEYQYTLNNNTAIMWLDGKAKEAIERTGARAGDEISILKGKQGRANTWQIELVSDATEPPQTQEEHANKWPGWEPQQRQAQPAQRPATQQQARRQASTRAASMPANHPGEQSPLADTWCMCLRNATIGLQRFQAEAKLQGFEFEIGFEDIRSLATTTFINFCKYGNAGGAR